VHSDISQAESNRSAPLHPSRKILFGCYKNNEETRNFFKTLIGNHFHFTASGQDWIYERWTRGKPPTYAEFATFWQKEYEARKTKKRTPKQEWAYINFVQRYRKKEPKSSQQKLADA